MNFKRVLVILGIIREEATETISRSQAAIATVTAKNAAKIEDAVDGEIGVIRYTIQDVFARINGLVATGAVPGTVSAVLQKAQSDIGVILDTVDAAI